MQSYRHFADFLQFSIPAIGLALLGAASPAAGQAITEFAIPTQGSSPQEITVGPDRALWFAESAGNKIGRITMAGQITEFSIPTPASGANAIVTGPDGNLWFTERTAGKIGRMTVAGAVAEFPTITPNSQPTSITVGADGNLWFTEFAADKIGRITPNGAITEFAAPSNSGPFQIRPSGDGSYSNGGSSDYPLWFTGAGSAGGIGMIGISGGILFAGQGSSVGTQPLNGSYKFLTAVPFFGVFSTETLAQSPPSTRLINFYGSLGQSPITLPTSNAGAGYLALGPDGVLWAIESQADKIARLTNVRPSTFSGPSLSLSEFALPAGGNAAAFVAGPDGGLWFAEAGSNKIGRLTLPTGTSPIVASILPLSRSIGTDGIATAFATVINATSDMLYMCGIAPITTIPAVFSYNTTDPTTNKAQGSSYIAIGPNGSQSYVISLTPTAPFAPTEVVLQFQCFNQKQIVDPTNAADPALSISGVNTLLLSASATPEPDIIAVAATTTNDGYLTIPSAGGAAAFAVGTANVGAPSPAITVAADTGTATLPLNLTICQTNSTTGACLAAPAPTVSPAIGANQTASFGVFAAASGAIQNLPAVNRIFLRFTDSAGTVRGSTSVAVRTP
jgi:streptogramin lyase